jgi:hypothetical protein
MTKPPTEVRRRLTLPDRIKAARQDEAAEKAQVGSDSATEVAHATTDTVTLPAATWERVRRLAELGERVERGDMVEKAELVELAEKGQREREQLQQAMAQVEALTAQLKQAMQQPVQAMPQVQAMIDDGRLLAMAAALRRRPRTVHGDVMG